MLSIFPDSLDPGINLAHSNKKSYIDKNVQFVAFQSFVGITMMSQYGFKISINASLAHL